MALKNGLVEGGIDVSIFKTKGAEELDYFDYDLVCVGFPVYNFTLQMLWSGS